MNILIPIISILYLELANTGFSNLQNLETNAFGMVLCAMAAGFLIDVICQLFKKNRWLMFILIELCTVFFLIEHFTDASYYAFMSPASIVQGAGGVATEFGDAVVSVIKGGVATILIFHTPAILILFRNIKGGNTDIKRGWGPFFALALACVLCQSLADEVMMSENRELFTYSYNYDASVRNFGVCASVKQDIKYMITDIPEIPPEDIPEPEPEPEIPPEPETEYNRIDWDLKKLKENASYEAFGKMIDYIGGQTATEKNDYTGIFEGKNLILICAESFSKQLIREDIYPMLYHMASTGIQVEDFYHPAWGGSTTSGEASILCGTVPTSGVNTIQRMSVRNTELTLASYFNNLGYYTVAMHNGDYDYYKRNVTHPALGFSEFFARGQGLDCTREWPGDDQEMFDKSVSMYSGKSPFYAYYMTISGHGLYNFNGNRMAVKNKDYINALNLDYSDRVLAYYSANYQLEKGLVSLYKQLEDAGELENTVIVITNDHYPYALQRGDAWANTQDYLSELYGYSYKNQEERDRSALIIWSPCLEELEEPIVAEGPSYTVDIIPTLLNLFGIDFDSRIYVGRDILSEADGLVIWADSSWKTKEGYYNAGTAKFIPAVEGTEVSDDYITRMKQKVASKIKYSHDLENNNVIKYLMENIN